MRVKIEYDTVDWRCQNHHIPDSDGVEFGVRKRSDKVSTFILIVRTKKRSRLRAGTALPPFRRPNNCHFESGRLPGIYYTDYGLVLSVQDSLVVMRVCVAYVMLLVVECSILAGVYLLFCSLIYERGY